MSWRSVLLNSVAMSWKSARGRQLDVAESLSTQIRNWPSDSSGETAEAALAAMKAHEVEANRLANYAGGMQLAYAMFADGVDQVKVLVDDAYDEAAKYSATIHDDGSVDVPIAESRYPALAQRIAQAYAALISAKVQAALDEADKVERDFKQAIHNVDFGDGVTDDAGLPTDRAESALGPSVADDDPLSPGENQQRSIGDCWLISYINAKMETVDGRQQLRDGVRPGQTVVSLSRSTRMASRCRC